MPTNRFDVGWSQVSHTKYIQIHGTDTRDWQTKIQTHNTQTESEQIKTELGETRQTERIAQPEAGHPTQNISQSKSTHKGPFTQP